MDPKDLSDLKARLEDERARLSHEVADLERDSATTLTDTSGENNYRDHMADQGTATFGKELDMSLEDNARDLLAQIDRALVRIEAGEYGTCVRCGEVIGVDRLRAMPAVDLCISCKEEEESR
jgi:RNA polymerase-binding protein DksA